MPRLDEALISLATLIGLLDNSGSVQWSWFPNIEADTLNGMQANRKQLGVILRALLDHSQSPDSPLYGPGLSWEPINVGANVGFGFVWNTPDGTPLQIGFGAEADVNLAGQKIDIAALVRLLTISAGAITSDLGKVHFSGGFPVPDFLQSGAITGDLPPAAPSGFPLDLTLDVTNKSAEKRTMSVAGNPALAWDAVRIAVFVLESWFRKQAVSNPGDNLFNRVDHHLFPALGEPASTIKPFPLVGAANMGTPPQFDLWKDSVLTTSGGASGALTFLWHLRALLTGNESPDFLSGSVFFPLVGPAVAHPAPPTLADSAGPFNPGATGVWLGILDDTSLVLDIRLGGNACPRIPLGKVTAGKIDRPAVPAGVGAFLSALTPVDIGGTLVTAAADGPGFRLTLLSDTPPPTGIPGFDGAYGLQLYLEDGKSASFKAVTPFAPGGLDLPPGETPDVPRLLLGAIVPWLLNAVPVVAGEPVGSVVHALSDILKDALNGVTPDAGKLLTVLTGLLGNAAKIEAGPLAVAVGPGTLSPSVELGPFNVGDLKSIGVHIGKLTAGATLKLSEPGSALQSIDFSLIDLRLGEAGGGGSGLIASLVPDLRQAPGFQLNVHLASGSVAITGGGKIPVQKAIGPLQLVALLVDVRSESLAIGMDLFFQLGPITVSAYELGIEYKFSDGSVSPFLHGLGLAFDASGIKLAGMFIEANGDYVGAALVSIAGWFELSAIGGYTQLPNGSASLFIFASLVAPLGGTPFFFVTGVAGGFGYNRSLPPPGLVADHPFMRVMRGEISIGPDPKSSLLSLSEFFQPVDGQYWIAAGFQFTSFGFINGKVIVAVGFGHKFSLTVLGLAAFGISPIAYFEIGIELTANEERMLLKAGLTPNTYLIHPDLFSLRGDFVLGVWYAAPHTGDFLLSVGGYHPAFQKPDHYPDMARVEVKAVVYGFMHLTVQCFFALTPQALMAGASVSLYASFAGISAGLDVYIDVLITWDPFFIQANLGICVWFEFLGRHEIGVDLKVHTPPFGGIARIKLFIVSFDVSFGSEIDSPPPPRVYQFFSKQLAVPAIAAGSNGAQVAAFNADGTAGLFRVDIIDGRVGKEEQQPDGIQEGLVDPVPVSAEFGFAVRTRLPINESITDPNTTPVTISGPINLPLCGVKDLHSDFATSANPNAERKRLTDFFPAANFGNPLTPAQADSSGRDAIAKIDAKNPSVPLTEGISYHYTAQLAEPDGTYSGKDEPPSQADLYPLPLGWPRPDPQTHRAVKSILKFSDQPLRAQLQTNMPVVSRRDAALAAMVQRRPIPVRVLVREAALHRVLADQRLKRTTVTAPPPGAVALAVPSSPARRPELLGVSLRIAAPRAPISLGRQGVTELTRPAVNVHRPVIRGRAAASIRQTFDVRAGAGFVVDLEGDGLKGARLVADGQQFVRVLFLGSGGDPLGDQYLTAGTANPPPRARRIVLLGEGMDAPVTTKPVTGPPPPSGAPTATLVESIGVEAHSTLVALTHTVFAGHGCVLHPLSHTGITAEALDVIPASLLLAAVTSMTASFAPSVNSATLILRVTPRESEPAPAVEQIRWRTFDAKLSQLNTVVAPNSTTFVMSVSSVGPWNLELDLGKNWGLDALVITPMSVREVASAIQNRPEQEWTDDRLRPDTQNQTTRVIVEVS